MFYTNIAPFVHEGSSSFPSMSGVIPNVPTTVEGVKALLNDFLICESRHPGIGLNILPFDKKSRKYVFFKAVEMGISPDWIHGYEMTKDDREKIKKHYLGKTSREGSRNQQDKLEEIRTRASIESSKASDKVFAQQMFYPENFVEFKLGDQQRFFCEGANTFQRARLLMSPLLSSELKKYLMSRLSQEALIALFDNANAELSLGQQDVRISPLALGRLFWLLEDKDKSHHKMKMQVFHSLSP